MSKKTAVRFCSHIYESCREEQELSNKRRKCHRQVNCGIGQCQQPCASQIPHSRVTGRPKERERKRGGERVSAWGMMLGKVLSGLITPDSCNLQVGSRGKSARFTLLRVSICRHYGTRLTEGRSASLRNGKQQTACDRLVVQAKGPSTDTSFLSLCEFVSRQLSPIKQRGRRKRRGERLPVAFVPVPR